MTALVYKVTLNLKIQGTHEPSLGEASSLRFLPLRDLRIRVHSGCGCFDVFIEGTLNLFYHNRAAVVRVN